MIAETPRRCVRAAVATARLVRNKPFIVAEPDGKLDIVGMKCRADQSLSDVARASCPLPKDAARSPAPHVGGTGELIATDFHMQPQPILPIRPIFTQLLPLKLMLSANLADALKDEQSFRSINSR